MKKKIVGLLICTLLIGTSILPVSGKITISTDIDKNLNEYLISDNSNYPLLNELDEFIIKVMLQR